MHADIDDILQGDQNQEQVSNEDYDPEQEALEQSLSGDDHGDSQHDSHHDERHGQTDQDDQLKKSEFSRDEV